MMSSDWVFPLHRNLNPTSKSVKTAEFSEMLGTLSAVGQRRSFPKVPQPLQYVIGGNRFGKEMAVHSAQLGNHRLAMSKLIVLMNPPVQINQTSPSLASHRCWTVRKQKTRLCCV